jgi:phenylpropionate dioxygenase-like ring-hydroxylating dioxygenase large terminal subunit
VTEHLPDVAPERIDVDGVAVVSWTDAQGCRRAALDRCPHRRAPLSSGTVHDGVLRCAYHGWAYAGDGSCVDIPALGPDARIPARAHLDMVEGDTAPEDRTGVGGKDKAAWLDGDTDGLEHFWHAVVRQHEVAPGVKTDAQLLGRMWTVARDAGGALTATRDDGVVAAAVTEHLDHVWVSPEPPRAPLPDVAEWGADGWYHRRLSRAEGRLGVGLLLDNQLDAAHFAFVHAATFGRREAAFLPPAEIDQHDTVATQILRVPIAARNDPQAGDARPVEQHRTMHYEFHAPLWLRLQLDYEELGGSTIILFAFVPLAAGLARMDVDMLFAHPDGFTAEQLDERMEFEEQVVGEDVALQLLFDDLRLPLDPSAELHTKADRYSLVCRELIRRLLDEVIVAT